MQATVDDLENFVQSSQNNVETGELVIKAIAAHIKRLWQHKDDNPQIRALRNLTIELEKHLSADREKIQVWKSRKSRRFDAMQTALDSLEAEIQDAELDLSLDDMQIHLGQELDRLRDQQPALTEAQDGFTRSMKEFSEQRKSLVEMALTESDWQKIRGRYLLKGSDLYLVARMQKRFMKTIRTTAKDVVQWKRCFDAYQDALR